MPPKAKCRSPIPQKRRRGVVTRKLRMRSRLRKDLALNLEVMKARILWISNKRIAVEAAKINSLPFSFFRLYGTDLTRFLNRRHLALMAFMIEWYYNRTDADFFVTTIFIPYNRSLLRIQLPGLLVLRPTLAVWRRSTSMWREEGRREWATKYETEVWSDKSCTESYTRGNHIWLCFSCCLSGCLSQLLWGVDSHWN